ncbi:hypothetical protein BG015_011284 [Linnemannia schmuckeri]|uniref:Uncharacterized protein n=1 Tax=Linnemannia schmuckeri TaxID=64567 RepID=A0A9P5RUZ8_9FUNG|nr:hypothetical protein BG015_011284 [Linnemannia schmuckeri]
MDLTGLKPSTPRPYKPKKPTTSSNQPTTPASKKKKLLGYPVDKSGHAALKKPFKSVFAAVTLTTESVKGCLKRATDLSTANVDLVAQRLDMAVSIVNTAKRFVYKMLEMQILRELLPTLKPKSQDALAEAMSIFANFKKLHPRFRALNPSNIPFGVVIDGLAPVLRLAMKLHYRKLPRIIRIKALIAQLKLVFDPANLPKVEQEDEDKPNNDDTTLDDEANDEDPRKKSKKLSFSLNTSEHAGAIS